VIGQLLSIPLLSLFALFALTTNSRGDCYPNANGLIGWWPGDGNASNVLGTNNGTLQGGATANALGMVSTAFNFDGTNGFVSVPDSPVFRPTNFTIEAWVKLDAMDSPGTANVGIQFFVFKQNTLANYFEGFWLGKSRATGTDHFIFAVSSAAGVFVPVRSGTIQTGIWYHLAAVRGSNYIQLYTNGQFAAQATVNFPQDYGPQPLYFGTSGQPGYDAKMKGTLDEVSIYNHVLSTSEITAIYTAGAAGKCKAPNITTQPQSATVPLGGGTNFSVQATGFSPLSYQWRFNGVNILAATNATLALTNLQLVDAGNYSVVISNVAGAIISLDAMLHMLQVGAPPVILQQPVSQLSAIGSNVTFMANVGGTPPFTFQWLLNETNSVSVETGVVTNFSSITISGINSNNVGDYRVVVTNQNGSVTSSIAQLLLPGFSEVLKGMFTNVFLGHVSWADYDNDGDLDLLVAGYNQNQVAATQLYRNDGNDGFTPIFTAIPSLIRPSADWGDFDNDGDLDLVIKGSPYWNSSDGTWIYRNDGNGQFTSVTVIGSYYSGGSVQWADLNNDGRLDVLQSTFNATAVIRNNGDQTFSGGFPALLGTERSQGTSVADFDNDGDLDTFLLGQYTTWLYKNTGGNIFINTGQPFQPFYPGGAAAWTDYNNDGFEDLILSGSALSIGYFTRLYKNIAGTLSSHSAAFLQLQQSRMAWGDINSDGRTDLLLAGDTGAQNEFLVKLYQNLGEDAFSDMALALPNLKDSDAKFGDYDNDGVLDLVLIGLDTTSIWTPATRLYHGNFQTTNSSPTPPSGLNVTLGPNSAVLSWAAATDNEQTGGLSYNVRIGTTPGGIDVLSPMANITTGYRLVPQIGNARYRQFFLITNLPAGNYYWSVQAIDHAFKGSTFSTESGFILPAPVITDQPSDLTISEGMPATFQVVAGGAEPLHYQWSLNGVRLIEATNAALVIDSSKFSDQGDYAVTITNQFGSISSTNISLTVLSPPAITEQPLSQTNGLGSAASFSGFALGSLPISYQWYFNGNPIPWSGKYWGATSNFLTMVFTGPEDIGGYTLVASNAYGYATTAVASLTVRMPTALLNVDFGVGAQSLKTGPAAIGQAANDFWNYYHATNTVLTNLLLAPQLPASVKVMLSGPRGPWTNANPDPMFGRYLYQNGFPGSLQVTTEGLPSGDYDFFYYGVGTCQMFVDGANKGDKGSGSIDLTGNFGVASTNWVEGVHYVLFQNVSLNATSSVRVVLSDSYAHSRYIAGMQISPALTKPQKPLCWTQPKGGVFPPGTNFQLSVTVTGQTPLQYQWFRNGVPLADDGQMLGVNSNILTVTSAATNHTGSYWLVATNAVGVSTSGVATVYVGLPPTVALPPLSRTNLTGTITTFTVGIDGTPPFSYRWQFNNVNLSNNARIQGAMSPTLTISNLLTTDTGQYRVVVTNGAGAMTSAAASLTVYALPTITNQPISLTVNGGTNVTFTVAATGTVPLRYQWQKNGNPILGATSPSLVMNSVKRTNAGIYTVTVTNIAGLTASSNAVLRVLVPQKFVGATHLPDGSVIFNSLDSDGGLISTGDLAGFQAVASTNLIIWVNLTNALSVTNGNLYLQDPEQAQHPKRFYRLIER
jgi:hypothetical protein